MALTQVVGGLIANNSIGASQLATSGLSASALTTGTLPKAQLPAGTVLQVVQGTYASSVTSTTNVYADTGLTATITPTSATSKVLIIVSHPQCAKNTNNVGMQLKLLRNGSDVTAFSTYLGYTGSGLDQYFSAGGSYLDSPATTSALTYKTQFGVYNNTSQVVVQVASTTSTIILMEIAA